MSENRRLAAEEASMNRFQTHSGLNVECRFCGFLSGSKHMPKASIVDTPWLAIGDYAAFVSIGALVPGWTLIVPKAHGINLTRDYQSTAFWRFAGQVSSILAVKYGRFSVFEHGAYSAASATSCGTAHAHLHLVPLSFNLIEEAKKFAPEMKWEECLATEIADISNGREYLFVADDFEGAKTRGHISFLRTEVSQFFRRVIATKLGKPAEYDYKANAHLEVSQQSYVELRECVSQDNDVAQSA
ncbi:hypothetical protein RDI61_21205 [Pseudomonas plecoglossicida]|nr:MULTISPECIES: hypothetical protein [Pseudomonas]MDQ7966543.1 hypothetical protein [Pseudomonas plecoglossicida]WBM48498.1 hypothetical protein M2J85_09635 [Pseudomonas putida]WFG04958.1 hypothetical protein P3X84_10135 [Pseudomonas putida]